MPLKTFAHSKRVGFCRQIRSEIFESKKMASLKQIVVMAAVGILILAMSAWLFMRKQFAYQDTNQLVVGTCSGFPPYEVLDEHGTLIGFDIDVAKVLAQRMHKKLVIKDMSFDALILALKQGKIAMALAGISITQARLKEVVLVHYQGAAFTSIPLIFWQHVPEGVSTIHDLQKLPNKTVCVQAGNIEEEIMKRYDFLTLKQLENIADLLLDIKYGKSIAATLDPDVAQALKQQNPELVILEVPLAPDEQPMGQGIGIAKGNKPLIDQVQAIIEQFKHDGTLVALEKHWFKKGDAHGG